MVKLIAVVFAVLALTPVPALARIPVPSRPVPTFHPPTITHDYMTPFLRTLCRLGLAQGC